MSTESKEAKSGNDLEIDVQAGGGVFYRIDTQVSHKCTSAGRMHGQMMTVNASVRGGDARKFDIQQGFTIDSQQHWKDSVMTTPTIVRMRLVPIWKLATSLERQEELKAAFLRVKETPSPVALVKLRGDWITKAPHGWRLCSDGRGGCFILGNELWHNSNHKPLDSSLKTDTSSGYQICPDTKGGAWVISGDTLSHCDADHTTTVWGAKGAWWTTQVSYTLCPNIKEGGLYLLGRCEVWKQTSPSQDASYVTWLPRPQGNRQMCTDGEGGFWLLDACGNEASLLHSVDGSNATNKIFKLEDITRPVKSHPEYGRYIMCPDGRGGVYLLGWAGGTLLRVTKEGQQKLDLGDLGFYTRQTGGFCMCEDDKEGVWILGKELWHVEKNWDGLVPRRAAVVPTELTPGEHGFRMCSNSNGGVFILGDGLWNYDGEAVARKQ
eukprot:TRINITY_DN106646_c0_g1_i1.p1 TRINITY_DN106646_c0_g1~~TRINITY_DN106646_c0_g1_i1.p1  ORF type:complete len:436 (+),score=59.81 TRINITY_DN106646_c0_g1_i1:600-1907(+)